MDRLRCAWVACAIAFVSGCHGQDAVLLTVSADAKVEQYQLWVHDDDTSSLVYSSGFTSVSTPGQAPLDLTVDKLKLALKLSRGGHFTLRMIGVIGEIENGKPASSAQVLFWAAKVHVDGAVNVTARLLTVPPGDDADGDYFPDAAAFVRDVPEAATIYANHADVLDCDDTMDHPLAGDGTPLAFTAAEINPFATEVCGDGYDENCDGDGDEACVDKDGDHDVHGHDCDDNDPKRHHATDIDPFPDPPNCCGYSLGMMGTPDEHTNFVGQAICPMQRCGDGIDESCRGVANDPANDTTCIVDNDCDGYPAPPQGNDCDDSDPNVHPGALEPCGSTKDLNCNGTIGEGCVPCDLDGDGYERADAVNGCPDGNDKHPGMLDCDDDDAGVFPGATTPTGGTEGGVSVGKVTSSLRGYCRKVYETTGAGGTAKINPFSGGVAGDADCNGKAYENCPALIDPGCDLDGDGWPGVAMSNGKNCNPGNVPLDCNDNDPTVFPSAPVNCLVTTGMYKTDCSAQGAADCSNDKDGDGYSPPYDCDDGNKNVHPWAVELCDGIDNDCDGLVDEGNPDPSGKPLVTSGALTSCTDSNTGECGKQLGSCVCSIAKPVVDPLLGQLGQPRTMCPGEGVGGKSPSCFGAGQPKPQSCDSTNPKDDDCDGRVDAPDGARLAAKGMTCGITVGQCKAGIVVACDKTQTNCFSAFNRTAPNTAWYVCSSQAPDPVTVCPTAEQCNGLDDDCDGTLAGSPLPPLPGLPTNDERDHDADHYLACSNCNGTLAAGVLGCNDCNDTNPSIHPGATELCNGIDDACAGSLANDGKDDCGKGANATKTTCCGGNGCRDTTGDFSYCGSCTNACTATNADRCYLSSCSCGMSGAPCGAGLTCIGGLCQAGNGASCSTDTQCQSGHCTDMHCCQVASCGTCSACTGANGTCKNQPSGQPGNGCPDASGNTVCDGGGACKRNIGQSCGANSDCYNGQCVDGFCCNAPCGGQCQACNLPGKEGTCSPVTGAPVTGTNVNRMACNPPADPNCAGACNGTNQLSCTYPGSSTACAPQCTAGSGTTPAKVTARACNGMGGCNNGMTSNCSGTIKCDATMTMCQAKCTGDGDCITSDYCSSSGGGTCTGRKTNGTACTSEDCLVTGCNYCQATCEPSGQCCGSTCAAPSCSDVTHQQDTPTCTSGTCQDNIVMCNGYICDPATSKCKTACAADSDCYSGFWCAKGGTCTGTLTNGTACDPATDCLNPATCKECTNGGGQQVACPMGGKC